MCIKCKGWEQCPYRDGDICWYEPNDYDGDIGSATAKEIELQNEGRIFNGKKNES